MLKIRKKTTMGLSYVKKCNSTAHVVIYLSTNKNKKNIDNYDNNAQLIQWLRAFFGGINKAELRVPVLTYAVGLEEHYIK